MASGKTRFIPLSTATHDAPGSFLFVSKLILPNYWMLLSADVLCGESAILCVLTGLVPFSFNCLRSGTTV